MASNSIVKIVVEDRSIHEFTSLRIEQKINGHHTFSLVENLGKNISVNALDRMQEYVGRAITITIAPKAIDQEGEVVFKGIIAKADMIRSGGDTGGIVISGYSPTIYMDGVPNTRNFIDTSIVNIIHETIRAYSGKVTFHQNADEQHLDYTVQYKESDFNFLRRLAQKKGHWFYYNGEELIYGKPRSKHIMLEYGQSLGKFNISAATAPLGFQYAGYDATSADTQNADSREINYESRGLTRAMVDASRKMYSGGESKLFYHHPVGEGNARSHLLDRVKTQLHGRASRLVTLTGISENTQFRIGDTVGIKEPKFSLTKNPWDLVQEKFYGNYYVISIVHKCDGSGNYSNEFQAVPDSVEVPPYTNVLTPPIAETQPAVVTDNNDPKGLGRVKVKFHWDYESPWIRMVQPHGGGSKGFYFIPEVGEEVLVAFEGGNAEKPYITGTMYNGNQVSGYATAGNDLKVIHSRSGTKIKMNDAEGSIFIEDPSGNTWLMDGAGNISVNAPNDISINAGKNININAGESITSSAGKNISETAGSNIVQSASGDIMEVSDNRTEIVEKDYTRNSATSMEMAEEITVNSTKENMVMQSAKTVAFNSGEKSNIF